MKEFTNTYRSISSEEVNDPIQKSLPNNEPPPQSVAIDEYDFPELIQSMPEFSEMLSDEELNNIAEGYEGFKKISATDVTKLIEGSGIPSFRIKEEKHPEYPYLSRLASKALAREGGNHPLDVALAIQRWHPQLETHFDPERNRLFMRTKSKSEKEINTNPWHPYDPERTFFSTNLKDMQEAFYDVADVVPDVLKGSAIALGTTAAATAALPFVGIPGAPLAAGMGAAATLSGGINSALAGLGAATGYRQQYGGGEIARDMAIDTLFPALTSTGVPKETVRKLIQSGEIPDSALKEITQEFTGRRARKAYEKELYKKTLGAGGRIYEGLTRKVGPKSLALLSGQNHENMVIYLKNPEEISKINASPLEYVGKLGRDSQKLSNEIVTSAGAKLDQKRKYYKNILVDTEKIRNFFDDKIYEIESSRKLTDDQLEELSVLKDMRTRYTELTETNVPVEKIVQEPYKGKKVVKSFEDVRGKIGEELPFEYVHNFLKQAQKDANYFATNPKDLKNAPLQESIARSLYHEIKDAQLDAIKKFGDTHLDNYPYEKDLTPGDVLVKEYSELLQDYSAKKDVDDYLTYIFKTSPKAESSKMKYDYQAYKKLIQNNPALKLTLSEIDQRLENLGKIGRNELGIADKLDIVHAASIYDPKIQKLVQTESAHPSGLIRDIGKAIASLFKVPTTTGGAAAGATSQAFTDLESGTIKNLYNTEKFLQKATGKNLGGEGTQALRQYLIKKAPYEKVSRTLYDELMSRQRED